jgi:hypothetical protein
MMYLIEKAILWVVSRTVGELPSWEFLEEQHAMGFTETDRGYWCEECKTWWSKGVEKHPHGFTDNEIGKLFSKKPDEYTKERRA